MQRRDVAAAVEDLGGAATVLAVSERTGLHPFVVVRRLRELEAARVVVAGRVPGMDWRPAVKEKSEKQKAEGTRFLTDTRQRTLTNPRGSQMNLHQAAEIVNKLSPESRDLLACELLAAAFDAVETYEAEGMMANPILRLRESIRKALNDPNWTGRPK